MPLLIESLSLNDMQLVLWTLRSLKFLINTKHDILSNNVQCIIPRLLQLTMKEIMVITYIGFDLFKIIPFYYKTSYNVPVLTAC